MVQTVKKSVLGYAFVLAAFGAILSAIISFGSSLSGHLASASVTTPPMPVGVSSWTLSPVALLLFQILVIIAVTRFFANAARKVRQPEVIGEVIGGIVLGPSVLGFLWPVFGSHLFAPASLANINILSQIGLVAFMFVVGLELDPTILRKKAHSAIIISHMSIIAPFLLGSLLALLLYRAYAPAGVPFSAFCLFMGIAMSITAFPVLARIIQERRLGRSPLGTMALACAAVDDLTAWCALALVVGIARHGTIRQSLGVTGLCVLYIAAMLLFVRPALSRWLKTRPADESLNRKMMATSLLVMLLSAFATEAIGIHALFGAFLAGVVMPKESVFRKALGQRIEDFSTLLLLPLFFALSGLRTQIGLLNDLHSWFVCFLIILVAVIGKLGGSALASRWSGVSWRESLAVGALMNTRGLVELVALNIGYDLGIITPAIFTMMVLMALATTLMTGPLLEIFVPDILRAAFQETLSPYSETIST